MIRVSQRFPPPVVSVSCCSSPKARLPSHSCLYGFCCLICPWPLGSGFFHKVAKICKLLICSKLKSKNKIRCIEYAELVLEFRILTCCWIHCVHSANLGFRCKEIHIFWILYVVRYCWALSRDPGEWAEYCILRDGMK